MNKIATTLAGLALVAGATIAPVFAQTYTANGPFTFTETPTGFTINDISALYYGPAANATAESGLLSLTGATFISGTDFFDNGTLSFIPSSGPATPEGAVSGLVSTNGSFTGISGGGSSFSFALSPGNTNPVPEASTVVSFGALLALGGLAVLGRKSTLKNAA